MNEQELCTTKPESFRVQDGRLQALVGTEGSVESKQIGDLVWANVEEWKEQTISMYDRFGNFLGYYHHVIAVLTQHGWRNILLEEFKKNTNNE